MVERYTKETYNMAKETCYMAKRPITCYYIR